MELRYHFAMGSIILTKPGLVLIKEVNEYPMGAGMVVVALRRVKEKLVLLLLQVTLKLHS